jgi:ferrous iron transport protein B
MNENGVPHIALAGNPNSGKSTIFNALTGLRQKVANYPGVTVEKKEGTMHIQDIGDIHVIDLPGTYSLSPRSLDEEVAHDILLGLREDTPIPQVVVAVVDASNLERNLFFASQLLSTGKPMVIALNMMDLARASGFTIDAQALENQLGVPVIPLSANRGQGLSELKAAIILQLKAPSKTRDFINLQTEVAASINRISETLITNKLSSIESAKGEALRLISSEKGLLHPRYSKAGSDLSQQIGSARHQLESTGTDWRALEADARYQWIESVLKTVSKQRQVSDSTSDRLDRVLTHRLLGPGFLMLLMLGIFTTIFYFAEAPMNMIDSFFGFVSSQVGQLLPEGILQSLVTDGIIAGAGSVLIFLPQILLLFLFISILEDTGYMARAAFIMDRIMGKVGLHGKAFIPLLSSFACAIPGVMATRTIENQKDRLVTILVAPLMCCSARWPVYWLLAGAFIPHIFIFGFIPLPALVIFSMVIFGVVAAILMAGIFKKTLIRGETPTLILELPPYRIPSWKNIMRTMWDRGWLFVKNAGTVILAISIVLWALVSFPQQKGASPEEQISKSIAGTVGRAIEPVIAPLGFDWKIGIAIITSFAAREVFVSSMSTIYGVGSDTEDTTNLEKKLQQQKDPVTGEGFFTPLRAVSLMVFYVLAMQCMSTVAIVKRETNGWKWPLFQLFYMSALAWGASFIVWQGGKFFGWN